MKNIYGNNLNQLQITPGFIFAGPSIMSTITFGGQTFQLETIFGDALKYYFDESIFDYNNEEIFNGTSLHSSAYAGPVYVGFSPSSALITILGLNLYGSSVIYSPFIAINVLFAGAHLSAIIYENNNPITIFDWHLNVSFLGVVIYQDNP